MFSRYNSWLMDNEEFNNIVKIASACSDDVIYQKLASTPRAIRTIIHKDYLHKYGYDIFKLVEKGIMKDMITFHDTDKLICYVAGVPHDDVKILHRNIARHHILSIYDKNVMRERILDWEISAYTKTDTPLNAYHFLLLKSQKLNLNDYADLLKEGSLWKAPNINPLTEQEYNKLVKNVDLETAVKNVKDGIAYHNGLLSELSGSGK